MLTIFRAFDKGDDGPGCRAQKATHSNLMDFQAEAPPLCGRAPGGNDVTSLLMIPGTPYSILDLEARAE